MYIETWKEIPKDKVRVKGILDTSNCEEYESRLEYWKFNKGHDTHCQIDCCCPECKNKADRGIPVEIISNTDNENSFIVPVCQNHAIFEDEVLLERDWLIAMPCKESKDGNRVHPKPRRIDTAGSGEKRPR
jgi:hypothetical protein